jgi:hypothetical protein
VEDGWGSVKGWLGSGAKTYTENADQDEETEFEEVPVAVEADLEEHNLAGSEGVHSLQVSAG